MSNIKQGQSLSYRQAGVDIDAGQRLVERIKPLAKQTHGAGVLGGLGGFGALFELPLSDYRQPVLVSGTDGVGTKLKLAIDAKRHETIGIDLVAMCVNDLAVCGAKPLFFLDYYATGQLDVDVATTIIQGIAEGCMQAGASLIGGETAEMPGLYHGQDYDLAGFAVGIVEKDKIIDGQQVQPGDSLIGLASSGPHANGYSLIRAILDRSDSSHDTLIDDQSLLDALLTPTRIYTKTIETLIGQHNVHALAHITGGGLVENLPRVLPTHCQAHIDTKSWAQPAIFEWLQQQGKLSDDEMYRTFNCGIGMVICLPQTEVEDCLALLKQHQQAAWRIGHISAREAQQEAIVLS